MQYETTNVLMTLIIIVTEWQSRTSSHALYNVLICIIKMLISLHVIIMCSDSVFRAAKMN